MQPVIQASLNVKDRNFTNLLNEFHYLKSTIEQRDTECKQISIIWRKKFLNLFPI